MMYTPQEIISQYEDVVLEVTKKSNAQFTIQMYSDEPKIKIRFKNRFANPFSLSTDQIYDLVVSAIQLTGRNNIEVVIQIPGYGTIKSMYSSYLEMSFIPEGDFNDAFTPSAK